MGLFSNPAEEARKNNLKQMEDARLRFAQRMHSEGFRPERMLIVSTGRGGYAALCRHAGQVCLIVSPDFGAPGEFVLETYEILPARREDFYQPAEGLGGIFGFGKKPSVGFRLIISRPSGDFEIPFITNHSAASIYTAKNPLLSTTRRRGDANLVWDLQPMDRRLLGEVTLGLR